MLIQATITNRSRMAGLPQTRPTRHRTIAAVGWAPSVIEDVLGRESLPVTPDPVDDVVLLTRYISIWDPPLSGTITKPPSEVIPPGPGAVPVETVAGLNAVSSPVAGEYLNCEISLDCVSTT